MDRRVVPFRHWHYEWMSSAAGEGPISPHIVSQGLSHLESNTAWTAVVDGSPIASAGLMMQWPGRHVAWAYMSLDTGSHMTWITREAKRQLAAVKGRIEMTVRSDFDAGHRWARMLGFSVESPRMVAYGPFGEDHIGYVRVNTWL